MKLLIRLLVFALVVGALAFAKIKYFPKENPATMAGAPQGGAGGKGGATPATTVSGYVVRPEKLDNKIFATGTVVASEIVDLKPEVAGKIVKLNIQARYKRAIANQTE
jgi:membrane fusion protein, multidrug efflux system